MIDFITICDYLGTFAFAISGIRLASAKKFDWFGAYVVGFVTAVGGGTVRDLFLGVTPFWMIQESYLIISFVALLFTAIFKKYLVRMQNTVFLFDAIGLGLFVVVGVDKTLDLGFPYWVAIIMGTITGFFGGMTRDILINEIPLVFRKDIYALACVLGGLIYTILVSIGMNLGLTQLLSALSVIVCRVLCAWFNISLPVLKGADEQEHNKDHSDKTPFI
ncbi:trimeric intracellular cation channel family protein [Porphyromonas sp. COT-108 OH1349]|uniref:trimeric intracellular cation channel family protein n=1 Tax=Porphyromonas sp. COT-108 OH1349 TaxID=1537504 RepID=UPI00052CC207|nr:trimeric intracellular cation channel family protein [Porphyromonas sp. COT-108 OH1349]KGN69302.1 membrane protein [Porphyromonas sp. COT-108 OH1349]